MRTLDAFGKYILSGGAALALLAPLDTAQANGFSVLYSFAGGSDGAVPTAGLIKDAAGDLYGTTPGGGGGGGTIFKLAPDGTETVLHAFTGGNDGREPVAGLVKDKAGNLYGTTLYGGVDGYGTVFKLAPDGTETVLHSFKDGNDGAGPVASLIKDSAGNLYSTTSYGGGTGCHGPGCGTVFKLAPDGKETVLHAFTGGSDGGEPDASLIKDSSGNLYGTTGFGGADGDGTVFKLAPDGTETVLYSFAGGSDGRLPVAGLLEDSAGNLYGTTEFGGAYGDGTVFKLAPDGAETVLHSFTGGSDGWLPSAGLLTDKVGNLYSTTQYGGVNKNGVVFKLAPDGTETVLHSFKGGNGGAVPVAGLIKDTVGNLYGTTWKGGSHKEGTVFRLKK